MSLARTLYVAGIVGVGLVSGAIAADGPLHHTSPSYDRYAGTVPGHDVNWHNSYHDASQRYWDCRYYKDHTVHHNALGIHKGKTWKYLDGRQHGFPFDHSPYAPRANGATYTFGEWGPKRSYYYPYQPGGMGAMPYGYSPEPY